MSADANTTSPFDEYLAHIERALDAEIYYAASALALALPDICKSCELPTGKTDKHTYKDWCAKYSVSAGSLEPHELYTLRCASSTTAHPSFGTFTLNGG